MYIVHLCNKLSFFLLKPEIGLVLNSGRDEAKLCKQNEK
jgi:hypothetical protein